MKILEWMCLTDYTKVHKFTELSNNKNKAIINKLKKKSKPISDNQKIIIPYVLNYLLIYICRQSANTH